jgi:DNA invertase Pin-like site-specific DNA recombinase
MNRNVIVYTRYSPQRNAETSESCEMQRESCEQYIFSKGDKLVKLFADPDASGADECREKLWQAIESLNKGSVLLVFKLDRLARNVYLMETIRRIVAKKGATIEAVTGDVAGDGPEIVMIRQVLSAISEYERKLIAQRTKWAMKSHTKKGHRTGRYATYGYKLDPNAPKAEKGKPCVLIPDEREMEAVKVIQAMRGAKVGSVVTYMNKYYPQLARSPGRWHPKTVKRILMDT